MPTSLPGFNPCDDIVIVRRNDPESVTPGGIVLPPIAQAEVDQGVIVAHGPGRRVKVRLPMSIKIGDKVIFSKYANLQFHFRGEDLITMREDDLIAVIEE